MLILYFLVRFHLCTLFWQLALVVGPSIWCFVSDILALTHSSDEHDDTAAEEAGSAQATAAMMAASSALNTSFRGIADDETPRGWCFFLTVCSHS